jgi:SET domain
MNIDPLAKRIGKPLRKLSRDERIKFIRTINKNAFQVKPSCMIKGKNENGLYANRTFEKGGLVGIYHGELAPYADLEKCFDEDQRHYQDFLKKYNIISKLDRIGTLKCMLKLSFRLNEESVLVMPRYPTSGEESQIFYLDYNPMLFVNEPMDEKEVENPFSKTAKQTCEVNVLALTNFEHQTIDYVACKDINVGDEILVYYGQIYNRDYNINK